MDRDLARARVITGTLVVCVIFVAGKFVADVSDWVAFTLGGG